MDNGALDTAIEQTEAGKDEFPEEESKLSVEDENTIQELLKDSKLSNSPRLGPRSKSKDSKGSDPSEDVRGRMNAMESRIEKQAAELSSVRQICSNQEQVLAQLLEQQRVTNNLLVELSSKRPQQQQSCADAAAGSVAAVDERLARLQAPALQAPVPALPVAVPKTPLGDQPLLSVLPGSISNPDDEDIKSEEPRSDKSVEPTSGKKRGWSTMRSTLKSGQEGAADQGKDTNATDNALDGSQSQTSQKTKSSSLDAKLKAVKAFQSTSSNSLANKKPSVKRSSGGGAVSSGALKRHQTQMLADVGNTPKALLYLRQVVEHSSFAYFFGVLIMANSVTIGIQTDGLAKNPHGSVPSAFSGLETFFCFVFLIELIMKIVAEGKEFIFNPAWKWNVFDFFIVMLALVEEISKMADAESKTVNLTFVRILRILRIVRIIRLIRVLKVFRELRVLINSIMGSLKSLCWTILLLLVIMYVVAVYITQVVAEHRKTYSDASGELLPDLLDEDHQQDLEDMNDMFGSVIFTLYSLYKAMSGGADWGDVAAPLEKRIHFLFSPFFCMYIAFAVFAVLNVVTGVFVNEAMVMAGKDQELVIEEELSRQGSDVNEFIRMFQEADADGSGSLSWEEFVTHMEDDRVKAYFKVLDLNIDEAEQLFVLLDPGKTGEVAVDDFVKGCVRMKGGAKSVDVQTILFQNKSMMNEMKNLNRRLDAMNSKIRS